MQALKRRKTDFSIAFFFAGGYERGKRYMERISKSLSHIVLDFE